jgi:hypothetical protein
MEFSHTYIMHETFDDNSSLSSVWTLTSNDYTMRPVMGFIDYDALDGTHTWRVYMEKNKYGNYMAEIKRAPSSLFECGFQVL